MSPPRCSSAAAFVSNPFATRFTRPGTLRYRFAVDDSAHDLHCYRALTETLKQHRCGVIVGPHGTGKSTLLYSLLPELQSLFSHVRRIQLTCAATNRWSSRRAHYRSQSRQLWQVLAAMPLSALLVIDGAEQLDRLQLWRLRQTARRRRITLLMTSHREIGGAVVLHRTRMVQDVVIALASELVGASRDEFAHPTDAFLNQVDWTNTTNVRELWFELYDRLQSSILSCHQRSACPQGSATLVDGSMERLRSATPDDSLGTQLA